MNHDSEYEYTYKFCKEEIWNMGYVLAAIIYAGLSQFRDCGINSYPAKFNNLEEWEKALDKMIWAFGEIKDEYANLPSHKKLFPLIDIRNNDGNMSFNEARLAVKEEDEAYENKIKEGTRLFVDNIDSIWD